MPWMALAILSVLKGMPQQRSTAFFNAYRARQAAKHVPSVLIPAPYATLTCKSTPMVIVFPSPTTVFQLNILTLLAHALHVMKPASPALVGWESTVWPAEPPNTNSKLTTRVCRCVWTLSTMIRSWLSVSHVLKSMGHIVRTVTPRNAHPAHKVSFQVTVNLVLLHARALVTSTMECARIVHNFARPAILLPTVHSVSPAVTFFTTTFATILVPLWHSHSAELADPVTKNALYVLESPPIVPAVRAFTNCWMETPVLTCAQLELSKPPRQVLLATSARSVFSRVRLAQSAT